MKVFHPTTFIIITIRKCSLINSWNTISFYDLSANLFFNFVGITDIVVGFVVMGFFSVHICLRDSVHIFLVHGFLFAKILS